MKRRYVDEIILKRAVSGSYLADIPVVKYLNEKGSLSIDADVTFFVGENGMGKSTLIEAIAIACGFNPEGDTKNFSFSTSHGISETHSELWNYIRIRTDKIST